MATIVGDAFVDIHARDAGFEREVRRMVRNIGPIEVDVKASITAASKTLRDFRRRQNNTPITVRVEADLDRARSQMADFYSEHDGNTVRFNVDAVSDNISQQMEGLIDSIESAQAQIEEIQVTANTQEAQQQIDELEASSVTVDAVAATGIAEAQLAALTRDRRVNITPDLNMLSVAMQQFMGRASSSITTLLTGGRNPLTRMFTDPQVKRAIQGFSVATAGIIDPVAIKQVLTGLLGNFEGIVTAAGLAGTAIGGISSSLVVAGGFVSRLLVDMSEVVGIAAALPAVFAGAAAGITAMGIAWSGFGPALVRDPEEAAKAIAQLNPLAQDTAWALQEIVQAVAEATETSYWERLGDAVENAADAVKGPLTEGMAAVGREMADMTAQVAKSVQNFATSGDLSETFSNIVKGIDNAEEGVRGFADAILTLTVEGSKSLPQFGQWFTDIGQSFNNFIQDAADAGNITVWIDQAVQRLQELGSILASTGSMFASIANAAEAAGIGGLTEMANGFRRAADALKTFQAQSDMLDIFRDSGSAFSGIMSGIGDFANAVRSQLPAIGDIFLSTGTTIQTALSHAANALQNSGMMDGLVSFFNGMENAMANLGPSFMAFGDLIGHLGEMGGVLLQNLAPGLNQLMVTLEGFFAGMKSGWMEVNSVLNDAVHILISTLQGPIIAMGGLLGNFLSVVAKIPAPMLLAGAAAVVFASGLSRVTALVGRLSGLSAISTLMTGVRTAMVNTNTAMVMAGTNIGSFGAKVRTGLAGAGAAFRGFGTMAMGALGGPIGLAVTAAIASITLLVGSVQQMRAQFDASVEGFASSWDAVKQSFSDTAFIDHAMNRMTELRGMEDSLEMIGTSAGKVAEGLSQMSVPELSDLQGQLSQAQKELQGIIQVQGQLGNVDMSALKNQIIDLVPAETLHRLGTSADEIRGMSAVRLDQLLGQLQTVAHEAELGAQSGQKLKNELTNLAGAIPDDIFQFAEGHTQGMRDAMASVNEQAGTLRDNFATINSLSSTVDQKFSAMQSNMQLMRLDTSQWNEPLAQIAQGAEQTTSAFEQMKTGLAGIGASASDMMKIVPAFDGASHAALEFDGSIGQISANLQQTMTRAASEIQNVATGAFSQARDMGASIPEAISAATSAAAPYIQNLSNQLKDLGFDDSQVNAILDTFGLLERDIEASLDVSGVDTAIQQMLQVELAAQALQNGDWTAYFKVMTDDAQADLQAFFGGVNDHELMANIKAEVGSENYDSFMAQVAMGRPIAEIIAEMNTIDVDSRMAEITQEAEKIINADFRDQSADARLQELLKEKEVLINADANPEAARAKLDQLKADAEGQDIRFFADAETSAASGKIQQVVDEAGQPIPPFALDADPSQANAVSGRFFNDIATMTVPPFAIDADPTPGAATTGRFFNSLATMSVPPVQVDADTTRAVDGVYSVAEAIGRPGTKMPVDADAAPARSVGESVRGWFSTLNPEMGVGANVATGIAAVGGFVSEILGRNPEMSVGADTSRGVSNAQSGAAIIGSIPVNYGVGANIMNAISTAQSGASQISGMPADVNVGANTLSMTTQTGAALANIRGQSADVNVGASTISMTTQTGAALANINSQSADVNVGANTAQATGDVSAVTGTIMGNHVNFPVGAETGQAVSDIAGAQSTAQTRVDMPVGMTPAVDTNIFITGLLGRLATPQMVTVGVKADAGPVEHLRGVIGSLQNKTVTINANNSPANGAINHIRGALNSIANKTVTINANNSPANGAINHIRGALNSIMNKTVTINANNSPANGAINHIRGALNSIANKTVTISANNGPANGAINHIRGALNSIANKTVTISANNGPANGAINHIRGALNSIANKTVVINANNSGASGAINHIRGALASIPTKTVTINANNSGASGAINHIRGAMASLPNKTVTINANNSPANGAINHIRGAMASLPDKTVTIHGNNSPANGAINHIRGAMASMPDKTVRILGNNSNAMAAIAAVNAARVQDKRQTITTVRRTVEQNAGGGIYSGSGVRMFANGGMMKKAMQSIQMHNFARGSENHTAQIARGGWPYRVWAEPETGGEAYIPLAQSKRARSTDILAQVANQFGYSLMRRFANGGVMSAKSTSVPARRGIQQFRNGGTTRTRADRVELRQEFTRELESVFSSFTNELDNIFHNPHSPFTEAVHSMRDSLNDALRDLNGADPARARRVRASRDNLVRQSRFSQIWYNNDGSTNISQGLEALQRGLSSSTGGFTKFGVASKLTLKDIEYGIDKVNNRLEDARSRLEDITSEHSRLAESTRDSFRGEFSLSNALSSVPRSGQAVTAGNLADAAQAVITKNNKFNRLMIRMRDAGYAPAVIAEVAGLGLDGGIATAENLLKSPPGEIQALNQAYKRLDETSAVIGQNTANIMYKSGIDIAQGLVNGLESQAETLRKAGARLSDSLVKSFKKALGIKSPSTVFAKEVGAQIPAGIGKGITDGSKEAFRPMSGLMSGLMNESSGSMSVQSPNQRQNNQVAKPQQNVYNYNFSEGSIVFSMDELKDIKTMEDFFRMLRMRSRKRG